MSNNVYINHPWHSSFNFGAPYSDARLEQIHKLCRNLVASLPLGCPNVRHAPSWPGYSPSMSPGQVYRLWVSDWKVVYGAVSALIRQMKTYRRTVRFPALTEQQRQSYATANPGGNYTPEEGLRMLSERHLTRLQETAQVLLNARYNAKLASAEAWRRRRADEAGGAHSTQDHEVRQAA